MKRFIDVLFISVKNARLMVKMNVDYKEYASEYAEYSERVVQVRQSRIERIWKKYIEKCKDSMIRSNMARYALEEEELGDHLKREQLRLKVVDEKRLLMLRRRLQRMETQTFICYDIDCKRRQFISQKRYILCVWFKYIYSIIMCMHVCILDITFIKSCTLRVNVNEQLSLT